MMTNSATTELVLDLVARVGEVLSVYQYARGREISLRQHLASVGLHDAGEVTRAVHQHLLSAEVYPDPDEVAGLLRECLSVFADLYPDTARMLEDLYPELRSPAGRAPDEPGRGLTLYRGETPGAIGCDVHGGYGQTWTLEPGLARRYARGDGEVVRVAMLPPTARRLVLVDPVTDAYNWAGFAELERVVDDPLIADRVRAGNQIYDIWRPAWTSLLVEAGYDSIATVGIEGPEEYVLKPEVLVFDEQASSSARRNRP